VVPAIAIAPVGHADIVQTVRAETVTLAKLIAEPAEPARIDLAHGEAMATLNALLGTRLLAIEYGGVARVLDLLLCVRLAMIDHPLLMPVSAIGLHRHALLLVRLRANGAHLRAVVALDLNSVAAVALHCERLAVLARGANLTLDRALLERLAAATIAAALHPKRLSAAAIAALGIGLTATTVAATAAALRRSLLLLLLLLAAAVTAARLGARRRRNRQSGDAGGKK